MSNVLEGILGREIQSYEPEASKLQWLLKKKQGTDSGDQDCKF